MRQQLVVALLLLVAMLAACGSRPAVAPEPESEEAPVAEEEPMEMGPAGLPMVDPMAVTGEIIIAGRSTVYPLAERMAERFVDEGYDGSISISSIGSGAGFERFCVAGETDVSNASRPIKDSEVESCNAIERAPIELRVGTDALAIVVSGENDFLTDVSMEELAMIFSTAATWSDVNADWPSEPIQRFSPGTDSGTFDYFVEEVFDKNPEPILAASELQLSEDDNVLVQGVLGSSFAIGYFGYAFYQENADTLKVLSINGVEATADNVDNASYPLARPLFMYTTASIFHEKQQVADFLNFVLSYVNEEIVDVGYFPASATDMQAAIDGWKMDMQE